MLLVWKSAEKRLVARTAFDIRLTEPELTRRDALYRAQGMVIEESRRKQNLTHTLYKSLLASMEEIERVAPKPTPPAAVPIEALPSPVMTFVQELGRSFAATLAKELAPVFLQAMKEASAAPKSNENGHPPAPEPAPDFGHLPEKFHVHKIAVLGLLGQQRTTIKQSFPHLDFRWIESDAKTHIVETVTKGCEASFVMIKFVKHQTDQHVKGNRVRVNGGVSELARLIESRFPRVH